MARWSCNCMQHGVYSFSSGSARAIPRGGGVAIPPATARPLTILELVPGLPAPRDRPRGSEPVACCPRGGLPRLPSPLRRFQLAQASTGGGVGALYLREVGKALVECRLNPLHSVKGVPAGGGGAIGSARRFMGTRLDSTVLPRDEVVPFLFLNFVPASHTRCPSARDFAKRIHPRWVGLLVMHLRRRTCWP